MAAVTRLLLAKQVFNEAELSRELNRFAPTERQREQEADAIEIERERVALLRHELGLEQHVYERLSLSPIESILVEILRRMPAGCPRVRMRERLALASEREVDYSAVHLAVLLSRIKPKLAAHGIVIERPRGRLLIGPDGQAKLAALEI